MEGEAKDCEVREGCSRARWEGSAPMAWAAVGPSGWRAGGPRAARGLVIDVVSMRGDEKRVFSLLRRGARPITEPQAGLGGEERVRSGCTSAAESRAFGYLPRRARRASIKLRLTATAVIGKPWLHVFTFLLFIPA